MNALIIGGGGFVGQYLIAHLLSLGWTVHATKLPHESISNPDCRVHDLNILDPAAIAVLLGEVRPDCILHLAAQSSVALSWKNPQLTIDINLKGTVFLLDAIRALDYKPRVLLIGSGEEYGHIRAGACPVTEEEALHPGNVYAVTKACQGMLGSVYAKAYDMDLLSVRAFNHVGPGQLPQFVVSDFCKQVVTIERGGQEPVIRTGNLSAKRDFTDVRDVVRAYGLLIEKGQRERVYNVGSGHAIAIQSILDAILALAKVPITAEVDPARLRPVDVPIIEADISLLTRDTGWTPQIPMEQTISETLDFWRAAKD